MQMPNSRQIRQILAVAIVAASAALAGTVVVRKIAITPPESASRKISPEIDMAMTKLNFSEMRDDTKLWDLVADRADYDKEPGKVNLAGLKLETFEGKASGMLITSQTGSYLESDRLVKMQGKVHAVSKRGMIFDTDYVEYRPSAGSLKTDRAVSVNDERLSLKAQGMELLLKDEKVTFLRQVDAVIEGKK